MSQLAIPNWLTNASVWLNPKISAKQISQESLMTEDRFTICILRQKKKKTFFSFSKDKHLQSKFALENKLCNKIIYLNY